jgi:hypothetical protein
MTIGPMVRSAWFAAAVLIAASGPARAAGQETTFRALINQGYQVVATSVITNELNSGNGSGVLVTLERGNSVAVCTLGIAEFENMNDKLETDAKACDYRTY